MNSKLRNTLVAVLLFNAFTAMGGGIALISGTGTPPTDWLHSTPLDSYLIPGIVLLAIVGGSALAAAVALYQKNGRGYQLAILSGIIMLAWIIGEILVIQVFSWLQVLYIITGLICISPLIIRGIKVGQKTETRTD